jgi:hypothetical protein
MSQEYDQALQEAIAECKAFRPNRCSVSDDPRVESQLSNIWDHEDRIERSRASGNTDLERKWTRLHGVLVDRLRDHLIACNPSSPASA